MWDSRSLYDSVKDFYRFTSIRPPIRQYLFLLSSKPLFFLL